MNKAETELKQWSAKMDRLQKESEKTGAKTRSRAEGQLRVVQAKLNVARRKLIRLGKSSEGAWEDLRAGADKALRDVKQAYQQSLSDLTKK